MTLVFINKKMLFCFLFLSGCKEQGANDTLCDTDGPNNDLLLANLVMFYNAYPDKRQSDFDQGFKYTGPNDYPIG